MTAPTRHTGQDRGSASHQQVPHQEGAVDAGQVDAGRPGALHVGVQDHPGDWRDAVDQPRHKANTGARKPVVAGSMHAELSCLYAWFALLVWAGQAASVDGLYDYWRQDRTARDARLELCQDTARYSVLCRRMHTGGPAPSQPALRNHPCCTPQWIKTTT